MHFRMLHGCQTGQATMALGFLSLTCSTSVSKNASKDCDVARIDGPALKFTSTSTKFLHAEIGEQIEPRPRCRLLLRDSNPVQIVDSVLG